MTHTTSGQSCFLCGSTVYRTLLTITQPDRFEKHLGISEAGYRRVWEECATCGLAHDRHPSGVLERLETLSKNYYEVDFAGGSIKDKYEKVMALPPEKSDNALRVRRIHDFLRGFAPISREAKKSALDVGAGTGVFLSRFLKESAGDWSGVGVEPDPNACDHLRSLGQFTVVQGLFSGQTDIGRFHLCTYNKVLEHIKDPVPVLKATKNILVPGAGVVYVEVPDKSTCRYRPPSDNIVGALHHHLYDIGSLERLFRAAGMVALSIQRIVEPSGKISVAGFAVPVETFDRLADKPGTALSAPQRK